MTFVSRGGEKLNFAVQFFKINVFGKICADFGSSTGGFVDCLLQNGALKVYAIETGYGILDWKLRNDSRVIVMERTNAMRVELPEKSDLITIDTSWTKLSKIMPNAIKNLKNDGEIIALLKPHYEAGKNRLKEEELQKTLKETKERLLEMGLNIISETESPILGKKEGNKEFLLHIKPK